MGELSVFQPFPHFDEQVFQLEPPTCSEDYDEILQNFVAHSNDYITTIHTDEFFSSHQKVRDENSGGCQEVTLEYKDSARKSKKKERVKRGRGRPAVRKSWLEKRDEANTRERRRMRDLVRWEKEPTSVPLTIISIAVPTTGLKKNFQTTLISDQRRKSLIRLSNQTQPLK